MQPVAAGRRGGCSRSPQPPARDSERQRPSREDSLGLTRARRVGATRPELQWARSPASATSTSSRAPIRWATAQPGRSARRPLVNPTASHRGDRPKTRETAQDGRAGRFGAHNSSPKQATLVAVLQDFRSRRPDSNRGPLHYAFRAAVTTSHQESPQVTPRAKPGGLEMTHCDLR
jgi:hypothetical protein